MANKYKLLIVESPHKAKTIQKYLGSDFKVTASAGHIIDLPKKELGVNLDDFSIKLVPMEDKKEKINHLKELIKNASEVYLAPDADREGEAIAYHLQSLIPKNIPSHRVLFNAITKTVIEQSIAKPGVLNRPAYDAQKARRILDRLMGYKISPLISKKIKNGLSAGRVQSAVLRIFLEKEYQIKNFVPENWYGIQVFLKNEDKTIQLKANYFGDSIDKKNVIEDKHTAEEIIKKISNKEFNVEKINSEEKLRNPSAPFTTSKLQQESNSKLKFPAKKTMEVAQKLYEGIEIQNYGATGLITYMRTDSTRIDPEYITKAREIVKTVYGEDYLPKEAQTYDKKSNKKDDKNIQDAHEAIRPTNLELSPEKVKSSLSEDQYLLYKLIWNKFISSQMLPAKYLETTITTSCENHFFKTIGKTLIFKGYQLAYQEKNKKASRKKGADIVEEIDMPDLKENSKLIEAKTPQLRENVTQAPSRYTEATINKEMEKKGIGRPATYVPTLEGLINRKYIQKNRGKFFITNLGEVVSLVLIRNFSKEMKVNYTAEIEKQLDKISDGELAFKDFLKSFWSNFSKTLEEAKDKMIYLKQNRMPIGVKCETCDDGEYETRWGKNGLFLSCNTYPKCNSTKNVKWSENLTLMPMEGVYLSDNKKVLKKHKDPCPDCGKEVGLIVGKFGKFYSCLDYPRCKFNMPYTLDIACPQCQDGYMAEKNYQGKIFYGCSNYPKCKFTLNKKPVKSKCNKCEYKLLTIESSDKESIKLKCPNCKQNYSVQKKN